MKLTLLFEAEVFSVKFVIFSLISLLDFFNS